MKARTQMGTSDSDHQEMINNFPVGNDGQAAGGALFCDSATAIMTNNTLCHNSACSSAAMK